MTEEQLTAIEKRREVPEKMGFLECVIYMARAIEDRLVLLAEVRRLREEIVHLKKRKE